MKCKPLLLFVLLITLLSCLCQPVAANNPVYEQRRQEYIDSALANPFNTKLILQAYRGVPLDTAQLNLILSNITTGVTSDFDIIELIRILYFTNGAYDAEILPVLNSVPYWVNYGDTVRNYWSENHMIMWMGSDWLLHERYGKPIDATLDARLRHYLQLKIQYGFYEFFSSVYTPYCLSGLLNLADFALDAQIRSLARHASQLLLNELLMLTNEQGVFYPAAGRNYPGKYINPFTQNHSNLIYLLTGTGQRPSSASSGGAFLATSLLPIDTIVASWKPVEDTLYVIGHPLDSMRSIHQQMTTTDRVVFQWSAGAYFHPQVVQETAQLLVDSNLWEQVDFSLLRPVSTIPPQDFPIAAESLSSISKSSVICGQQVAIFKHHSITLSSVQDFWKGKVGFQQYPCVAAVGNTAVFTGSGEVKPNWNNRNSNNQNTHLPYVHQKRNVALLMYRPETTPALLGANFTFKEVALHWRNADFDEVMEDSLWLIGRQAQNYVAVRRSCVGEINTVRACPTNGGQAWVIVVGDSILYNNFSSFQQLVNQSQFEERWYIDSINNQSVYYAKIVIDTTTIEYAWNLDSVLSTGLNFISNNEPKMRIVPNPANENVSIHWEGDNNEYQLEIFSLTGERVYQAIGNESSTTISTSHLNNGVYFIKLRDASGTAVTRRMVVVH